MNYWKPKKNVKIIEDNEFFVEITGEIEVESLQFSREEINRVLNRKWKTFESAYDLGVFQTDLPNEVRRNSIIEAFNINEFLDNITG